MLVALLRWDHFKLFILPSIVQASELVNVLLEYVEKDMTEKKWRLR